jgi:hypothetical protein
MFGPLGSELTTKGAEVIRLTTIVVGVLFDDEQVRAGAGYFVTKGPRAPEVIWLEVVEEAAGSAALERAIDDLGQGLRDNVETALASFLDAVRTH